MATSICFICQRPFGEGQAPAETWAHGSHILCVCRRCVDDPPGGPPRSMDELPEELRGPLVMHLTLLSLRAQSRRVRRIALSTRLISESVRDRLAWVKHHHLSARRGRRPGEPPK